VEDVAFEVWLAGTGGAAGVSVSPWRVRAQHARPDSDWDYALSTAALRPWLPSAKAWPAGLQVGGWGDGVMSGGAWLTVEAGVSTSITRPRRSGALVRRAAEGRFKQRLLLFYAAGIPTYVVNGGTGQSTGVAGSLPRRAIRGPSAEAGLRWHTTTCQPELCVLRMRVG